MRRCIGSRRLFVCCVLVMMTQLSSAFFFKLKSRKQTAKMPIDEQCLSKARRGDCAFYPCFSERHHCNESENNYAIQYGWRFCSRFDLYYDQLTPEGKRWLNGTRLCAMERLIEFYRADAVSCSEVDAEMKEAQAACEAENGLCHGRLLIENREIFADVYSLNRRSAVRFLHSVKQCTLQKFHEAASWLTDKLHSIGDVGQSVVPFFRELEERVDQLKEHFQNEFNQLSDTLHDMGRSFGVIAPEKPEDDEID